MALVVKNPPANAGESDVGSIPGLGRSPGGGYDNPLQYSCLENPMDRGDWQAVSGSNHTESIILSSSDNVKTKLKQRHTSHKTQRITLTMDLWWKKVPQMFFKTEV